MKKILSLVMVVAMLVAVLAFVGCDNQNADETTTAATTTEATTTEATTTTEETTTTATTTTETTTLFPVFGRFDFGTDTKAEELGMTSHEYLTGALTYDEKFISVTYTEDSIIVTALQDHPEITYSDDKSKNGAEAPEGYSVTSYALCFENLTTFDFDDSLKKTKKIMRVRLINNTKNNVMAIRWHKAGQAYATTLLASCMYLQGGSPDFYDFAEGNQKLVCEPTTEYAVYDYDVNFLAALGRSGANKQFISQSYAHYVYYKDLGGDIGANNWNWMGNSDIAALEFFVLGAYGGSPASERYYFTYADTRENIVEGATVEIDYIIFGDNTTELDKFTSNIEDVYNESVSISESISKSSYDASKSAAEAATATTAAA